MMGDSSITFDNNVMIIQGKKQNYRWVLHDTAIDGDATLQEAAHKSTKGQICE